MPARHLTVLSLFLLASGCGGATDAPAPAGAGAAAGAPSSAASSPAASRFAEGKDYVVVERVRIIDAMGFDRPVEASSILVPRGWRTEAAVRWKSVGGCRGEIVSEPIKITSPDGAITFEILPVRSFSWTNEPVMLNALQASAPRGGCQVSRPFEAAQWLQQAREFGGASATNVRRDEALMARLEPINAQANATARQYGQNSQQSSTAIYGDLSWPDGTQGLAQVGVSVMASRAPNMFGPPVETATTLVFFQAYVRYPPNRRDEGLGLFRAVTSSHRVNPVWQQAKEAYLNQVGNIEHQIAMNTIRLMGEQAKAYADEQSKLADARMRDWERRQASADASHDKFIRTIREVDLWKTSDGQGVTLNAGYDHAWSRPNGTYILTNNPQFDPAVAFQQDWTRMEKIDK